MTTELFTESAEYKSQLIGTQKYPVCLSVSLTDLVELNNLRALINTETARRIQSKMHNNAVHGLGEERPLSAYFTLLPKSPTRPKATVLVEWGKIQSNGDAKLHTFLNEHINHIERHKEGATIISGHISPIKTELSSDFYNFALMDSLNSSTPVTRQSREFGIVTSLIRANFIPITSDGYPVKLEI